MKFSQPENIIVPTLIALFLISGFIYYSPGLALIVTFVPAMVIAYVCYLFTSLKYEHKAERVLPIYLFALAVQMLHFSEEFVGGFYDKYPQLIDGSPGFDLNFFVIANMGAYFAFLMGAIGIYKGWKIPMLIVWFFAIMGICGNAILHLLFTIMNDGYFPGLYTSLIYWILGPVLVKRLLERK